MAARSVQISIEEPLLARVDRHPIAKKQGRSALIRAALQSFLADERKRANDEAYERAYGARAAERLDRDLGPLMKGQRWPEE